MYERILVPLDGSEVGEAVLPKLEELVIRNVPKKEVEVTLLKVISQLNFNFLTDDKAAQLPYSEIELRQLKKEAQEYLEQVAGGLKSKGINVKIMVALGQPAEEIIKASHEINANLIAMSTHGRNGFVRWAVGSVTDKVIRLEGRIPVLAVRTSPQQEGIPVLPKGSLQSLMKHS